MSEQNTSKKQEDEDLIEDFGKKEKKKKSKKDKKTDAEEVIGEADEQAAGEDDDKKEKKKKSKKDKKTKKDDDEEVDEEEEQRRKEEKKRKKAAKKEKREKEGQDSPQDVDNKDEEESKQTQSTEVTQVAEDEDNLIIDFTKEKKKKKEKKSSKGKSLMDNAADDNSDMDEDTKMNQDQPQKSKPREERISLHDVEGHEVFTYDFLLQKVKEEMEGPIGDGEGTVAFKQLEPKCGRTATKSMWINFPDQADAINRDYYHILSFFMAELGCEGTIGNENMLILNGGFQPKNFFKIMKLYIDKYVKCDVCQRYQTDIVKENKTRLQYLNCRLCKASRVVPQINMGFRAVKRGQRRKDRMKV